MTICSSKFWTEVRIDSQSNSGNTFIVLPASAAIAVSFATCKSADYLTKLFGVQGAMLPIATAISVALATLFPPVFSFLAPFAEPMSLVLMQVHGSTTSPPVDWYPCECGGHSRYANNFVLILLVYICLPFFLCYNCEHGKIDLPAGDKIQAITEVGQFGFDHNANGLTSMEVQLTRIWLVIAFAGWTQQL